MGVHSLQILKLFCYIFTQKIVQQECIPQAIMGTDLICQAKSGMGKTAVFVLAVLQQVEPEDGVVDTLVVAHTRELAWQICKEFDRFGTYFENVRVKIKRTRKKKKKWFHTTHTQHFYSKCYKL